MIQRVQSIFLLLAGTFMILILFFNIWESEGLLNNEETKVILDAYSLKLVNAEGTVIQEMSAIYIAVLSFISGALALFTIFKFKNRKFQQKLGLFNLIIMSLLMLLLVYLVTKGQEMLGTVEAGSFEAGFFMPPLAIIFTLMANRYIGKDEKLVRSMDRLR